MRRSALLSLLLLGTTAHALPPPYLNHFILFMDPATLEAIRASAPLKDEFHLRSITSTSHGMTYTGVYTICESTYLELFPIGAPLGVPPSVVGALNFGFEEIGAATQWLDALEREAPEWEPQLAAEGSGQDHSWDELHFRRQDDPFWIQFMEYDAKHFEDSPGRSRKHYLQKFYEPAQIEHDLVGLKLALDAPTRERFLRLARMAGLDSQDRPNGETEIQGPDVRYVLLPVMTQAKGVVEATYSLNPSPLRGSASYAVGSTLLSVDHDRGLATWELQR